MSDVKQFCFTTQVIPSQNRTSSQFRKLTIHNSSYTNSIDTPYQKMKRLKQQMKEVQKTYLQTISQNHKIQYSLNKIQRNRLLKKAQFMKIYGNIKYKRSLHNTITENQLRVQTMQHQKRIITKKKKLQQDLEKTLIKNQEQYKIHQLQKKNRQEKQKWNQKKLRKTNQIHNWSKNKHDQVKNQYNSFVIRKSNISSMLQQRSRFNYIKKVNKELNLLKDYQKVMQEINTFKVEQIQKIVQSQGFYKINPYQTFFMTTKNTLTN